MNKKELQHARTMGRLWKRLAQSCGSSFISQFGHMKNEQVENGDNAFAYWSEKLFKFSQDVIIDALDDFIDSGATYAPTLPFFISLCNKRAAAGNVEYYDSALEHKPTQTEAVQAKYIEQIAAELSGKKTVH